jgi:hypothetical protein
MDRVTRNLALAYPDADKGIGAKLVPLKQEMVGEVKPFLLSPTSSATRRKRSASASRSARSAATCSAWCWAKASRWRRSASPWGSRRPSR